MTILKLGTVAFLVAATACGTHVIGEAGGTGSSSGDGDGDGDGSGSAEGSGSGGSPTARHVDLLFVVDNSGSMGAAQATLARTLPDLTAALEAASPPVDFRIAFTTTDNGNAWCSATTPEMGQFRASSCRARTEEFVFSGTTTVDVTQEACLDVCTLDNVQLDGQDPWVESIGGVSNVMGASVAEAVACLAPQGINGCGFEQPLEAMFLGIGAQPGFIDPDGLLAVVFVSDEADCSATPQGDPIFLDDGGKVFWSDPTAGSPTSAVCWNAGVTCTGVSPYDECHSENKSVDGSEGVSVAEAVMHPVTRYTGLLSQRPAFVGAVLGVPAGYVEGGPMVYQDGPEQGDFGIGPGCGSGDTTAIPPVRMREVAETANAGERSLYSICAPDFENAMGRIASSIIAALP